MGLQSWYTYDKLNAIVFDTNIHGMSHIYRLNKVQTLIKTRIGVFAQGQILCIFPNGVQDGHCDALTPSPTLDDRK